MKEKNFLSDKGSLICPPGISMIFLYKKQTKNALVARPVQWCKSLFYVNLNLVCFFRHISLVPQFHAFVGSLTNLTHLKLSNCCTDQLLAVIGANCVNLEVLDAEEDSEMMTTDHGLAFLANCRNLRCGQKHIFSSDGYKTTLDILLRKTTPSSVSSGVGQVVKKSLWFP